MLDTIYVKNKVEPWVEKFSEIIPIGPDTDCMKYTVEKDGKFDLVTNVVFAIMPDGGFIKPEGSALRVFDSALLAWKLWSHTFEGYVARLLRERPDLQMSWNWGPQLTGWDCGLSNYAFAAAGFYEKQGVEWEFDSEKKWMIPVE